MTLEEACKKVYGAMTDEEKKDVVTWQPEFARIVHEILCEHKDLYEALARA